MKSKKWNRKFIKDLRWAHNSEGISILQMLIVTIHPTVGDSDTETWKDVPITNKKSLLLKKIV